MAAAIGSATNGQGGKGTRPGKGRPGAALKWKTKASASLASEAPHADGTTATEAVPKKPPVANGDPKAVAEESAKVMERPADLAANNENNAHEFANPKKSTASSSSEKPVTNGGHASGSSEQPTASGGDLRRGPKGGASGKARSGLSASVDNGDFPGLPSGLTRPDSVNGANDKQSTSHILAQQLKSQEARVAQRKEILLKLRADSRKLQEEAQDAVRQEGRIRAESTTTQAQAKSQEELLRERHVELQEKVKEEAELNSKRQDRHRQRTEELTSMCYQEDAVSEQSRELERSAGVWRKAAADALRNLRSAEAKFKSLEVKREEHPLLKNKLQAQAVEHLRTRHEAQAEVEELKKTIKNCHVEASGAVVMWQGGAGVLLVLLFLLIFVVG